MSNLPFILSLAEELDNLLSLRRGGAGSVGGAADYDFGYGDYPYQLQQQFYRPANSLLRLAIPVGSQERQTKREKSSPSSVGKAGFQVSMDVQQFKPNELTVKTVNDCVVVEGKHEEREDEHGFISRHFVRRYNLPKGYNPEEVVSTLSSDGVLTITVPKPKSSEQSNERVVTIQQTGPAHLSVKENQKEDSAAKEGGDVGEANGAN